MNRWNDVQPDNQNQDQITDKRPNGIGSAFFGVGSVKQMLRQGLTPSSGLSQKSSTRFIASTAGTGAVVVFQSLIGGRREIRTMYFAVAQGNAGAKTVMHGAVELREPGWYLWERSDDSGQGGKNPRSNS